MRPLSLVLVGLALSIGWGIRGNYGHELGAMFPGALAGVAACLVSGREDWHRRVVYFGLFGMLGWAFGGSISYMMVIGYTHSGHAATQLFGFFALFAIGFLWAAFGGAGTSLPAVLNDKQLREIFIPLTVVLLTWVVLYFALDPLMNGVQRWLELDGIESPMQRQERALYWLDTDWLQVAVILTVLLGFDLIERRFEHGWWLLAWVAGGGLVSYLVFLSFHLTIGNQWIVTLLVQPQGVFEDRFPVDQLAVTNWPKLFLYLGSREGLFYPGESLALWGGATLGIAAYFVRFGRFAYHSGLFVAMAVGWLLAFLALPVIGSLFVPQYGGLRLTPPRGDNWAGILGALIGGLLYCWRRDHRAVVAAALICGTVGGVGFSGVAWLEGLLVSLGNGNLTAAPELWTEWQETLSPDFLQQLQTPEGWEAWQEQNWHSFLEQSYGFVNGLGVAIALAVLATRLPRHDVARPGAPWMLLVSLIFVFPVLAYANLVKNLRPWMQEFGGYQDMPSAMAIPWTDIQLSTPMWFDLMSLFGLLTLIAMFLAHRRRKIAILPDSWVGRGQMLFLAILWTFVIGNFTRALPDFREGRLLTEGIIYFNALLASWLVLYVPSQPQQVTPRENVSMGRVAIVSAVVLLIVMSAVPSLEFWSMRRVYGDAHTGKRGMDFRFGPNANWKRAPLLKGELHR